jgi:DNA mismatch endonuclease (patch repair protein)
MPRRRPPRRSVDGFELLIDPATSARLARVRQKGTKPELEVRRVLRQLGHRYRVSNRDLPGSPDLANRSRHWVIFVHGCFWHRHTGCVKSTTPKRNRAFWEAKFAANHARDRRAASMLRRAGYSVVTIWECETGRAGPLGRKLARLLPGA